MSGKDDKRDFLDGMSIEWILDTDDKDDGKPPFFKEEEEDPELTYDPPQPSLTPGGGTTIYPSFTKDLDSTPEGSELPSEDFSEEKPDLKRDGLTSVFDNSRE